MSAAAIWAALPGRMLKMTMPLMELPLDLRVQLVQWEQGTLALLYVPTFHHTLSSSHILICIPIQFSTFNVIVQLHRVRTMPRQAVAPRARHEVAVV